MSHGFRNHERCACGSSLSQFGAASPKPFVLAGTRRVYERARPFGIQHIALDLTLDFDAKSIAAVAELEVTRVDGAATELSLDAVGFVIDHVAVAALPEGRRAAKAPNFVYDGETLLVPIAPGVSAATVRVTYSATPRRGLYFLAPDEHVKTARGRCGRSARTRTRARLPLPRQAARQADDRGARDGARRLVVLSNGELTSSAKETKKPPIPLEDERAAPELPRHDRRGRVRVARGRGGRRAAHVPRAEGARGRRRAPSRARPR
jgi:aminopeptidase N